MPEKIVIGRCSDRTRECGKCGRESFYTYVPSGEGIKVYCLECAKEAGVKIKERTGLDDGPLLPDMNADKPYGSAFDRMKGQKDAILKRQENQVKWESIETAPRDGESILVAHNHWGTLNVTIAAWGRVNYGAGQYEDGWRSSYGFLTCARWWHPIPSVEGLACQ